MTGSPSAYPISTTPAEIARLRMQADAMAFDAAIMLDRIGVGPGWRCLDLACGCGGITDLLQARVGSTGQVVGLDRDVALLAAAGRWARGLGLNAVEFVEGDARATDLQRASFDMVHMRFILSTAGDPEPTLAEALALTKPGGIVAAQEPDIEPLHCHPAHPAWDRLRELLGAVFTLVGGDIRLARQLYQRFLDLGLSDVQYRPFIVGFGNTHAMADYLPTSIESVREPLLAHDMVGAEELEQLIADCRGHLASPRTISTSYLVAQVWGRKPV